MRYGATIITKGYYLWTPLRQNMDGANHHNNWKLMAKRRTIETRFSVLNTEFDTQRHLVRSLRGLELWLENIIWAYHLRFFN